MPLQTGQILNQRYRIVKLLAKGGFGSVYRAWDVNFQMPCALKENSESSPESQRQFQREAQMLHTLRHPNLPLVKDYFIVPGQGQYLVMDFVEGDDLETSLARDGGPFPVERVEDWLAQICEAVIYLHSQNPPVIHRDIKPANIRITSTGKAMLVDFGIAKIYQPGSPTTQGARAVSPGYAPFEQYGHAPTDVRTDVYALGATAYCLLTGTPPAESISRMAGTELPAPHELNLAITPELETLVLKAMAVMPAERFQTAGEFLAVLNSISARSRLPAASAVDDVSAPAAPSLPVQVTTAPSKAAPSKAAAPSLSPSVAPSIGESGLTPASPVQGDQMVITPLETRPQGLPGKGSKVKTPGPAQVRGKRRAWLAWVLVGIFLLVAVGAGLWQSGLLEPDVSGIGGVWSGRLFTSNSGEVRVLLEILTSPDARFYSGTMTLNYPDGRFERFPLEGSIVDGSSIRFRDFRDGESLYFWGNMEGNRLVGTAGWGCYECAPWGTFEISRE